MAGAVSPGGGAALGAATATNLLAAAVAPQAAVVAWRTLRGRATWHVVPASTHASSGPVCRVRAGRLSAGPLAATWAAAGTQLASAARAGGPGCRAWLRSQLAAATAGAVQGEAAMGGQLATPWLALPCTATRRGPALHLRCLSPWWW